MSYVKQLDNYVKVQELLLEAQNLLLKASELLGMGGTRDVVDGEIQACLCVLSKVIDTLQDDMQKEMGNNV